MTKAADIMTTDPTTIDQSDPVSDAFRALSHAPYHHLVVMAGDKPVGMVSSTDLLRLVHGAEGTDPGSGYDYLDQQFTMDDAMSADLKTVGVDASLREVAAALADGSLHSVVVVSESGSLAGIVTTTDLARHVRDNS
ncbi:MAG: CBS domain-containing protein [Actinomycetia bacterium]|nr:CBS domain-containing protein [Actinomycetes bacterium]